MMAIVRDRAGLAYRERPSAVPPAEPEEGRPAAVWLDLFTSGQGFADLCRHLGLVYPTPPGHPDAAPLMVLNSIGIAAARIVAEGKRWREAMKDEDGTPAIILPVGDCGELASIHLEVSSSSCLLLAGERDDRPPKGPGAIIDLIALPLTGGAAASFTGLTAAVGSFVPDETGALTLAASGVRFLKRHIARAYAREMEWPPHLVARRLPFPDHFETLMIDPGAFEWRMSESGCVVSESVLRIVSPDSVHLAQFVDHAMKLRDRVRKPPPVEKAGTPSAGYVAAAREARDWIAANHGLQEPLL